MKERPILFSGPMIRAILDGSKTQTRRVAIKTSQPHNVYPTDFDAEECTLEIENSFSGSRHWKACPYGKPEDRLWVRETWNHSNFPLGPYDDGCTVFYRADYLDDPHGPDGERSPEGRYRTWRPSIHMPRAASRIALEITRVRVERLQEISIEDAMAEGAALVRPELDGAPACLEWRYAYEDLWNELNGRAAWDVNPWVWVIEFKRVQP